MNETEKTQLLGMTPDELAAYLKALGQPAFRAKQVFSLAASGRGVRADEQPAQGAAGNARGNLHSQPGRGAGDDSNPSSTARSSCSTACRTATCIEGVLMRYQYGNTLCLSTQVGCRMGCAFCASTLDGCARSLTPAEMLGQIVCANGVLAPQGQKVGNIVLMGSGEPLDNYDNVVKFLRILRDATDGLYIGMRSVSLSTCGLVAKHAAVCARRICRLRCRCRCTRPTMRCAKS